MLCFVSVFFFLGKLTEKLLMPQAVLPISSSLVPVVFHFPVMPLINGALWGLKKKISLLYFCRLHAAVLLHIFQCFQPVYAFIWKKLGKVMLKEIAFFNLWFPTLPNVGNTAIFCLRIFKEEVSKFAAACIFIPLFFLEITKVRLLLLQLPLV